MDFQIKSELASDQLNLANYVKQNLNWLSCDAVH